MTRKTQYEIYLLGGLMVALVFAVYSMAHSHDVGFMGVHAADDGKFEPLNVADPSLRIDLLDKIQREEYNGRHRNIFSAEALAPPPSITQTPKPVETAPAVPPPPPPLTVPATFYGIVTDPSTGKRQACFSANTDDIYILSEGGTLLNQFRVTKIGNNTVELQEISSGRSTTLTLPADQDPNAPQTVP